MFRVGAKYVSGKPISTEVFSTLILDGLVISRWKKDCGAVAVESITVNEVLEVRLRALKATWVTGKPGSMKSPDFTSITIAFFDPSMLQNAISVSFVRGA
jgi:hypothetical protein